MKTIQEWDRIAGASRRLLVTAELLDSAGTQTGISLPVIGGTVRANINDFDRWEADIDLGGYAWPDSIDDPLMGFTPAWVSIRLGAVIDTIPRTVEVCRLLIDTATLDVSRTESSSSRTHTLRLVGLGTRIGQGVPRTWAPQPTETAQEFLIRAVREAAPPWAYIDVEDTSTPYDMPVGYSMAEATPLEVVEDVEALADIVVYFDHLGRLILKDAETSEPPAVLTLDTAADISGYQITAGPGDGFANVVELDYSPTGSRQRTQLRGDWDYTTGTGSPNSGQVEVNTNNRWRIHYRDNRGRLRRAPLRRVAPGDVVQTLTDAGGITTWEVTDTNDVTEKSFVQWRLTEISSEGPAPTAGQPVEIDAYIPLDDTKIVTRREPDTVIGTQTVGSIVHQESRNGDPSERAGAYAASILQATLGRALTLERVDILPDPRLEPGDPVDVVHPDRTVTRHYVTTIDMPLDTSATSVGLRTYPTPLTTQLRAGG